MPGRRREPLTLTLAALVSLLAAVALTVLSGAAAAGPARQPCPVPTTLLQPCPQQTTAPSTSTPTTEPTTTAPEESTTTTAEATTSTARPTTTATSAPTTEAPPATPNSLVVPGPVDVATGQPITTTTVPATAESDADNAGTIVALVISGLLVVALAIAILTWRYWRGTRPKRVAQQAMNTRTLR